MQHLVMKSFLFQALCVSLSALVLCWFIRFILKRQRLYNLAAQFNGPRSFPIIGDLAKCLIPLSEIPDAVQRSMQYYKSPQRLWFGPHLVVHIFDPENLKILLNSPRALEKQPWFYKIVEMATGRGIDTIPVEEWKRRRRLISPCFNQKSINSFFDSFVSHANRLVIALEEKAGTGICVIQDKLVMFAMSIVTDGLLGSSEVTSEAIYTIYDCINQLFVATTARLTNPWYFLDCVFEMTPYGKHILNIKRKLDTQIDLILHKWKEESMCKKNNAEPSNNNLESKKLVEHLLAIDDGSGKLTAEELRGDVNNLISGGIETTPRTMGFALILLGMHPQIQEKLYQEIAKVVGSKQQIELGDLKNFEYLESVLKEVMRLFPPATGIARYTEEEVQLTSHIIPRNTSVVIGLLALHRNPDVWPNPNKFDPDRFLPEEEAKRHPYSWLPFSGGPRNCIALRFAWMSLKVLLASMIMKYKITTDYKCVEDIHLTSMFAMQPTDGFRIAITVR